jgi:two-component system, LytTR family, response regulator
MKALIVDDERRARNEMRRLLEPYSWIQVVGEASNVSEAFEQIEQQTPDVVFLDIQMPKQDGFQLVTELSASKQNPKIIFTTAFDEFAIRAFEVNALDYLLKPIVPERLKQTMSRLKEVEGQGPDSGASKEGIGVPLREADRVFLRDGGRCWFVSVKSIRLLESDGDYTRVHFDDQQPLIYRTVSSLEERLPKDLFFRANRRQIINLGMIAAVTPWFSNTLKVTLKTGEEIEISRRSAKAFRQRLSL